MWDDGKGYNETQRIILNELSMLMAILHLFYLFNFYDI